MDPHVPRRLSARVLLLFACAAPAAVRAQAVAALPPCQLPAADSHRMAIAGGRVSIEVSDGLHRLTDDELAAIFVDARPPELMLSADSGRASVLVYTLSEVARVDAPNYQESRQRLAQAATRGFDRWLATEVVEQGGGHWMRQAYTSRRGLYEIRHLRYLAPLDGRTVVAELTYRASAREWSRKIQDVAASLQLAQCAPAAALVAAEAQGSAAGARGGAVCGVHDLHARVLADDPRRAPVLDGRVSLVLPDTSFQALTSLEVARTNSRGDLPAMMFGDDSATITIRVVEGAADLDSPAFRAAWEKGLERGVPYVVWKSRDVVEMGGARWLRLVFAFPRREGSEMREVDESLYLTAFQGGTLSVAFAGPPGSVAALDRSGPTLQVRDCRLARPSLAEWADSAGLAAAAAALPAPRIAADMKPLFRVIFDTAGVVQTVEPVYAEIPADYAGAAAAAIRAHLRPQPRWPAPTSFLVRVAGGPDGRVDSPEVVERPAELVHDDLTSRRLGEIGRSLIFRPGAMRQAAPGIIVRMRVGPDGRLDRQSVQLVRASGVARVDNDVLSVARGLDFTAGEVDGLRAVTWIVVTLGI